MELEAELADIQARFDPEGLVTPEKVCMHARWILFLE